MKKPSSLSPSSLKKYMIRFKTKGKVFDVAEPINDYTPYLLTEIWIRPTITYGLVACFVSETADDNH